MDVLTYALCKKAINKIDSMITTDETTIEGNPINFTTKSAQNAKSTIISIEPIQDLHGYDKPWVGGAGKNKLPLVLTDIKSANTDGTWSNNTYTLNSCNFTVNTDSNDNVISIEVSGTPSATSFFTLYNKTSPFPFSSTNYIANGCPSGGSVTSNYKFDMIHTISGMPLLLFTDTGNGANVDFSDLESATEVEARIVVYSGASLPKTFYPMIRLATESDATFEPYTNECSISGRSYIRILGTNGKESTDPDYKVSTDLSISFGGRPVYGGTFDVEKGERVVTNVYVDLGDLEWESGVDSTGIYFKTTISGIKRSSSLSSLPYAICSNYFGSPVNNVVDKSFGVSTNGNTVYVRDLDYSDATSFKNAMDGVGFCYELAEPYTIQRIPNKISLLEGVNNISTDGDKITLTYRTGKVATLDDLKEQIAESQILTDTITGDNYILKVTNGTLRIEQIGDDEEG